MIACDMYLYNVIEVIIACDRNCDFLKISEHRKIKHIVIDSFLLLTEPIRITHSTATLIDNIDTNADPRPHFLWYYPL